MIATLSAALEELKERLAEHPEAVPLLTSEALEHQFHGLTLSQVARLVDAPALTQVVATAEAPDEPSVIWWMAPTTR